MVAAELDEPLVQRVRDEVMVVIGGGQGAVEKGLELDRSVHAAELEVAQPELVEAEDRVDASTRFSLSSGTSITTLSSEGAQHAASTWVLAPDPARATPTRALTVEGA